MRKSAAIFLTLILCVLDAAAQIDSVKLRELDTRLESYFSVLEPESPEVKSRECDALIEAATDPYLKRLIALKSYNHYLNSLLMGDEAVAIHLTDKWFSTGVIEMESDKDLLDAKLFADFNRQSLIGMPAPEIVLADPYGAEARLFGDPGKAGGRFVILYFYDTDCAKCKLESALLRSLLDDKDYPVDVYAVYVGRDEDAWRRWRESTFVLRDGAERVYHLWDPEDASGYQMKYGVTVTPRLFLVSPDGVISGRGLETGALERLLEIYLGEDNYQYGGEEAFVLFDELFSMYGLNIQSDNVGEVASLLEARTLGRGDTLSFKRLEGDLLYYLVTKRGEGYKEGTLSFVRDYILSRPVVWNTSDDSLKVIGLARMQEDLLSKTPVGSRIPKTSIKGWNKTRRKGGYFMFRSTGCSSCAAETAAADSLGVRYLPVDVDRLEEESPEIARELLETFDLSGLPFIIETGRRGLVKRRYISLAERLLFLEEKD